MTASIKPPRPSSVSLGTLTAAHSSDLDDDHHHDGLDFAHVEVGARDLTGAVFLGCDLSGARVDDARLRAVELTDCRVNGLAATSLDAPESTWRRCELTGSRIGAATLHGGQWRQSTISGCKLSYVNLRGASLVDVAFVDCVIEDLDLVDAHLERVAFTGCRVAELSVRAARCVDVDLRGLDIGGIDDVGGLSGTLISVQQLVELSGTMASHLGVAVDD